MKQRLQKILAQAGIASRRKAEQLIAQGRVAVNGVTVTELGTGADAGRDRIMVDGTEIQPRENRVYLMLHKPAGYICSRSDPEGRPTVMNPVGPIPQQLYPVGRLDWDTEGLLVLTNDGDFAQRLMHPRYGADRVYRIKVRGVPTAKALERMRHGVYIDGVLAQPKRITLVERTARNAWLEVVLPEGRNQQLKIMGEAVGHPVQRIVRRSFGPLQLESLPVGTVRHLNREEIDAVRALSPRGRSSARRATRPLKRPAINTAARRSAGTERKRTSAKSTPAKSTPAKSTRKATRQPRR